MDRDRFLSKLMTPSKKVIADKARDPEETVRIVEERLRKSGLRIYKGVQRIDKGRLGIPVYISLYDIEGVNVTNNYKQMGKGSTDILARASALMELVERYSLFSFHHKVKEKAILTTYEELGERAIPWEVFLASLEDEEEPTIRDYALSLLRKTPLYFVPALELSTREIKYLPFHWFWILYEYNGSAGGNTYSEASVQAICELIERHTNALSIRANTPMRAIREEGLPQEVERLLEPFRRLGIRYWIRDMTFGMPVPTIAVLAQDPSTFPHRSEIVYAGGTATSPSRALIRAITEVAQLAGDFDTEGKYLESGLPKFSSLDEAKMVIDYDGEVLLEELPNIYSDDHREELEQLTESLKNLGYEVYLIDIEEENLKIPAVYAIIPGILFRERTRIPFLFHLIRTIVFYHGRTYAKELLEKILSVVEDRYYVWGYYGNVLKEEGKLEEALMAYEKALTFSAANQDTLSILSHLADTYFRKGEFERVIEVCQRALELGEVAELYNLMGRAYYRLGNYLQALDAFLRATELNPASAIDYANAGYCLKNLNFIAPAEIFFRKALALDPNLTMAKRGLEYCENLLNNRN